MQQEWVDVAGSDPDFSGATRLSYVDDFSGLPDEIPLERNGRRANIRRLPGKRVLSSGHGLVDAYEIFGEDISPTP
jgi:hypothetical protein